MKHAEFPYPELSESIVHRLATSGGEMRYSIEQQFRQLYKPAAIQWTLEFLQRSGCIEFDQGWVHITADLYRRIKQVERREP